MPKYSPFAGGSFRLVSPYGDRTLNGVTAKHNGIDIIGSGGDSSVVAVMGGKILRSRQAPYSASDLTWQWGNYVSVQQDDGNIAYYCHLASRAVSVGDYVRAGDNIGIMGNTGYSTGPHLHFEVRTPMSPTNAAEYLGIPNAVGTYAMPTVPAVNYAELVCQKCGLEQQTRDYIDAYRYAEDLWRKLYRQMT